MSSVLICPSNHIKKDNNVDHNSREYMKTVESGYKEKEICKKAISIFIVN
jgi:hypothetical protein